MPHLLTHAANQKTWQPSPKLVTIGVSGLIWGPLLFRTHFERLEPLGVPQIRTLRFILF